MSRPSGSGHERGDRRALPVRGAVVSSIAAHAVGMVTNLAAVPFFLRAFGQELYGFWGAILALTSYLGLLNLGIAQTVSSRTAVLTANGNFPEAARTTWYGIRRFTQGVLVAIAPVCFAAWLVPWGRVFDVRSTSERTLQWTAALVVATFLFQLPLGVPRAALIGAGGVVPERLVNMVGGVARLGIAWAVLVWSLPLPTTVVALFGVTAAAGLVTAKLLARRIPAVWDSQGLAPPEDLSGFRRASAHYLLLQVAGAIVWSTDAFLAGVLLDASAAARVSVAWRVASAVLPLGQLVGPAISPALVRSWAQGRPDDADALASAATQLALGVTAATAASLAFAAPMLFGWWVGTNVYVGNGAWTAYCLLVTLQALIAIPEAFVTLSGRHHSYARWTLVEAVVKIVLTIGLVRSFGFVGFPLATLIGRLPVVYILLRETAHAFGVRILHWVLRQLRPTLVAAPAFIVAGLPFAVPALRTTTGSLAALAVAGALFLLVFWRFGLARNVRGKLLDAIRFRT